MFLISSSFYFGRKQLAYKRLFQIWEDGWHICIPKYTQVTQIQSRCRYELTLISIYCEKSRFEPLKTLNHELLVCVKENGAGLHPETHLKFI